MSLTWSIIGKCRKKCRHSAIGYFWLHTRYILNHCSWSVLKLLINLISKSISAGVLYIEVAIVLLLVLPRKCNFESILGNHFWCTLSPDFIQCSALQNGTDSSSRSSLLHSLDRLRSTSIWFLVYLSFSFSKRSAKWENTRMLVRIMNLSSTHL